MFDRSSSSVHVRMLLVGGGLAAALALSACGGSERDADAAASPSASSGDLVAQATAKTKEYTATPTSTGVTAPLSKAVPGKNLAVVNCGSVSCQVWTDATVAAAKAIGWKTEVLLGGLTPQTVSAAWAQILRVKPDAVATIGAPRALYARQAEEAEKAGIPIVSTNVTEEAGGGVIAVFGGERLMALSGQMHAWWVLSQKGDDAHVLAVTTPGIPSVAAYEASFSKTLKTECGSCTIESLSLAAGDGASGAAGTKIVGALRSKPDVNYVVSPEFLITGLPKSVESAGLAEKVSIAGHIGNATDFTYLEEADNPYKATTIQPLQIYAWLGVDTLARNFNGQPLEADRDYMVLTTKDNLPSDTTSTPTYFDYQSEFKKLWLVD